MCARWAELRLGLLGSLRNYTIDEIKGRCPALAGFRDFPELLAFLARPDGDLDAKDALYRQLIALARRGREGRLAVTLLWLGLWPALDRVYRRQARLTGVNPCDLVSAITWNFTRQVHTLEQYSIRRVAASLVRNTRRDVCREWVRTRLREVCTEPLCEGAEAPVDPPLLFWSLSRVLGEDLNLLLAVVLEGETPYELGVRLGISCEAARKRIRRALIRARRFLSEDLSHFGLLDGV